MEKNNYGQYFTPSYVAALMVEMLTASKDSPILEPSAGEGVFLDALYEAGFTAYEGLEIDETLSQDPRHKVHRGSFVSWKPSKKYRGIIGNPPYIRWKNLELPLQEELKTHSLWGTLFNPLSDYLSVFIANSVQHLEVGGELVFITPSFWMHTKHSENLREWLISQGAITNIVDFGESKVFSKISSSILIFKYVKGAQVSQVQYARYVGPKVVSPPLTLDDSLMFEKFEIPAFQPGSHWTLASKQVQESVSKLERNAIRRSPDVLVFNREISYLGDYVDIANGMVSGLDRAFRISSEEFVLLDAEQKKATMLVSKAKDLELFAPKSVSQYIDIPIGLSEEDVRQRFPSLVRLLEPYRTDLEKRYSYGRDLPFWEWAFRRSEAFLTSPAPKGLVPCKERMTNKLCARFAVAKNGEVATQDVTAFAPKVGVRESIEYIVGYLSTPQVSDWIRVKGLMKGGIAEFSEKPLSEIPFRGIDWSNPEEVKFHDEITTLVSSASSMTSDEKFELAKCLGEKFSKFS